MISNQMTRREMLGGKIAAAGASPLSGPALADGFVLAADEELFVGFIKNTSPTKTQRHWHTLVCDDGSAQQMVWYPPNRQRDGVRLEHGARIWIARQVKLADGQTDANFEYCDQSRRVA